MTMRKKSLAIGSATTLVGGSAGALLLALAAAPAGAIPTTFTVDTLDDGAGNSSDCTTPVANSCSLRDALDATHDGDTILFASGLTGTISITAGELYLSDEIVIRGPGADVLTIDAGGNSRVFYVCAGPTTEISGLTITGGSDSEGGGFYDECDDGFTLRDVVLTGNSATNGGGGGLYSGGPVTLINTVVSNNTASDKAGGVLAGSLTMVNSTVTGNSVTNGNGGGTYTSGLTTATNTVVSNNTASDSGGGVIAGDLTVMTSTISGNSANTNGGGGALAYGAVEITDSTFDSNTAVRCGGGLYTGSISTSITITGSTFSSNTSDACYGGGIDIDGNGNVVLIANTTITGNSAVTGGGLHVDYSNTVTLAQDTIVGNSASTATALYSGGGVHFAHAIGALALSGTIVAGNTAVTGPADIGAGNGTDLGGAMTANDSLLGDVATNVTVTGTGNVMSIDPGVSPLADNGGPTRTMALLPTSKALDAGPATVYSFPGNAFDQRGAGFPRVVGTKVDVGAFEDGQLPAPTTTASDQPVAPAFTG